MSPKQEDARAASRSPEHSQSPVDSAPGLETKPSDPQATTDEPLDAARDADHKKDEVTTSVADGFRHLPPSRKASPPPLHEVPQSASSTRPSNSAPSTGDTSAPMIHEPTGCRMIDVGSTEGDVPPDIPPLSGLGWAIRPFWPSARMHPNGHRSAENPTGMTDKLFKAVERTMEK
ncbi:hypothetical protein ACHAPJ_010086 [Fusarium lateritium]